MLLKGRAIIVSDPRHTTPNQPFWARHSEQLSGHRSEAPLRSRTSRVYDLLFRAAAEIMIAAGPKASGRVRVHRPHRHPPHPGLGALSDFVTVPAQAAVASQYGGCVARPGSRSALLWSTRPRVRGAAGRFRFLPLLGFGARRQADAFLQHSQIVADPLTNDRSDESPSPSPRSH